MILCDGCDSHEVKVLDGSKHNHGEDNDEVQQTHSKPVKQRKKGKNAHNYKHGTVTQETAHNYHLYLQQLREKVNNSVPPFNSTSNGSIELLELPHRHGSAVAISAAFTILSSNDSEFGISATKYVMICQHDNFFVRDVVYLEGMLEYMEREENASWLQCVHFPSTATLNYVEKVRRRYHLDLDTYCHDVSDEQLKGSLIPLVFWYGRTHIGRTSYYNDKILKDIPLNVGDHLEELWGTRQLKELLKLGNVQCDESELGELFRQAHSKYGNYVFFEKGDEGMKEEVLYHLSGRKACASNVGSDITGRSEIAYRKQKALHSFQPQGASFTTARRAVGVVPGLTVQQQQENAKLQFTGQFRQRCFHCGLKGHSFKFCPEMVKEDKPEVEVLDLS